jgi:thiamine monophosphate kinase
MVQHISSGSPFERDMAYSRAVVDGDWIWVAGTTGDDQAIDVLEVFTASGQPDGYLVVGYVSAADGDFADCTHRGKIDIALARLTAESAFTTVASTWGVAASSLGLALAGGEEYFIACSVNATGATAGVGCVGGTVATAAGAPPVSSTS